MKDFGEIEAGQVRAKDLLRGDIILSPALRIETVTAVETREYRTTVSTSFGTKSYTWRVSEPSTFPTIRTSAATGVAKVFLCDDGRMGVTAFVSANPDSEPRHPLVGAGTLGRGQGWSVNDATDDIRVSEIATGLDRRAAVAKVRTLGKAHARRLDLPFEEVR